MPLWFWRHAMLMHRHQIHSRMNWYEQSLDQSWHQHRYSFSCDDYCQPHRQLNIILNSLLSWLWSASGCGFLQYEVPDLVVCLFELAALAVYRSESDQFYSQMHENLEAVIIRFGWSSYESTELSKHAGYILPFLCFPSDHFKCWFQLYFHLTRLSKFHCSHWCQPMA